jgi:hypothetical protein
MEAFEEAGDVGDEQVEDPSLGVGQNYPPSS